MFEILQSNNKTSSEKELNGKKNQNARRNMHFVEFTLSASSKRNKLSVNHYLSISGTSMWDPITLMMIKDAKQTTQTENRIKVSIYKHAAPRRVDVHRCVPSVMIAHDRHYQEQLSISFALHPAT